MSLSGIFIKSVDQGRSWGMSTLISVITQSSFRTSACIISHVSIKAQQTPWICMHLFSRNPLNRQGGLFFCRRLAYTQYYNTWTCWGCVLKVQGLFSSSLSVSCHYFCLTPMQIMPRNYVTVMTFAVSHLSPDVLFCAFPSIEELLQILHETLVSVYHFHYGCRINVIHFVLLETQHGLCLNFPCSHTARG